MENTQRAIGLLRQQALSYGIDPHEIGVIGFSAGAYLAANMSNTEDRTYSLADAADRQSPRPDFAIVAYTARMLDSSRGRNSLELRPYVTISPKAPPTMILHAMNDPMDAVRPPMAYALALSDAGVPIDLRLYAKGGHAFGMRPTADLLRGNGRDRSNNGCTASACCDASESGRSALHQTRTFTADTHRILHQAMPRFQRLQA
ncbi:alpha/beta hydrolase [Sphingomonas sp. PsM26]|nr:alpha/beta hydrolase [Sphingomonas sp. PsM26]